MKKRIMMVLLAGCLTFSFTACNSTNTNTEDTSSEESGTEEGTETEESTDDTSTEDGQEVETDNTPITDETVESAGIDAFMTLGEYKGIDLTRTVYTVTDEEVDEEIQTELASHPEELTDPDATVAEGDVVNINYEGKVDGTAFDGGTQEGADLTIGSGQFIDGFEDQLVGWKVGQSGDITVTFPDPYENNPDLAGQEAVFTVTINSISRPLDEPTDAWLAENTTSTTLDDYKASIKQQLEETNAATTENTLKDDAWNTVFATAEFTQYPQDLLDECTEQQKASYESYATMYGMEYDAFLEATGITEEDLVEAAKNSVQNSLTLDYIADKEGITEDSEAYQTKLSELLTESGLASKEEAIEQGITEWNIDFVVKYNLIIDLIVDNANITDVDAATTSDAAATE